MADSAEGMSEDEGATQGATDEAAFDWNGADGPFVPEIPDAERFPLPPSNMLQGWHAPWADTELTTRVPDLRGRDLATVKCEAERVRHGEQFDSFQEFDRCLHSWCVLNGRVAARSKTARDFCLRVCRFAEPIFEPHSKPGNSTVKDKGTGARAKFPAEDHWEASENVIEKGAGSGFEFPAEDHWEASENVIEKGAGSGFEFLAEDHWEASENVIEKGAGSGSEFPAEDHWEASENVIEKGAGSGSEFPAEDHWEEIENAHCISSENNPAGVEDYSSQVAHSSHISSRAPLQDIPVNTIHKDFQNPVQVLHQNPRTVIQRTSTWLPSQRAADSAIGMKTIRTVSARGACGELTRFLPPPVYDDPTDEATFGPCPFRVRCQRQHSTGRLHITICKLKHTCPQYKHKWRGPTQKARWLGETLANRITRNVKVPARELVEGFATDYHRTTTYHQAWRGKDLVRDWHLGGQTESFHRIPSFLQRLQAVDPECVVDWTTYEDGKTFMRAFICPSGTRGALQFCQPVVCLDAAHTKNRKYPTQMFLATVLDGNNQVLVLCYAVAPTENSDNWTWFLQLLQRAIQGIDNEAIPFISDRQKGLMVAVRDVFPGKIHGHCANHLRANVKTLYGKGAEHFFTACVYSNSKKQFEDTLRQLKKSLAKGVAAAEYIEKIETRLYARHAFPLPRFGKISSNPCEQANTGLLPLREFAPLKLLVELWFYIQTRFRDRKAAALTASDQYTQPAQRRLKVNLESYGQWQVLSDGHCEAKVQTHDQSEQYLVRRSPQLTCSCVEVQEMCWPCQHVMAWDNQDGADFTRHFHKCWRIQSLRALYMPVIPCFISVDLSLSMDCCPPEAVVKKGRHRVVRMQQGVRGSRSRQLGEDESIDAAGNLVLRYPVADDPNSADAMPSRRSTAGVSRRVPSGRPSRVKGANVGKTKCGRCGGLGHNRRSCATHTTGILCPPSESQSMQEDVPPLHVMENTQSRINDGISQEYNNGQNGEIVNGRFGHTQNPQQLDWMAHGLDNWVGIPEMQDWIELAESIIREGEGEGAGTEVIPDSQHG